ncbi:Helicase associated domain protein [Mycolicibacterium porcinum]
MPAFTDLFATLAADPRMRGSQFEHICRWYLENEPQYRSALRQVWLWDDWPGRWSADAGIDLVAEDQAGRLWAIQAKAYDPKYTVTKADVDTFLAESSRAVFSYRLLIATTDRLSPNGRRTIDAQEKAIGLVGLSDLLTADVNWPANPARLRPSPPPKPAKPRGYQREAIRAAVIGFDTADRGQMIMACGTGKTLTAQFIAAELAAQRTLVLVPSLSLLKQTMRVWQSQGRPGVEALPVCSDETVSRTEDIPVEHVSELGLPVTTDPGEIAAFLRKRSGPRVVFSTYQSSPRIAEAFALGRVPAFDLIVADEAHRCAGPQSSNFSAVLDGDRIRAHRRLFMTATPRYFTGRVIKAAGDEDLEVASMDDETTFGPVFHRLGFSEAISRRLLTDYQVAIVGVDDSTYRAYTDKGTLVTRDGDVITDARSLAGQIGLAKAMRKYDLRRVISFHSRVARAQRFATEMPDVVDWMPARQRPAGGLWSRYASGAMTAGERHVLLQRLRRLDDGERGLLANARCLAEGVDVPTLDGVAFIDPRRSEVDIVQAVGRAIRKADDKTVGTIVIPVFIDSEADPEAALDDSVFKPVWDVIKALRAHDDDLAEQIDTLRREMGRRGGGVPKLPDKIHLDVPVHVGAEFVHAFDTRLVEQTSRPWEFWFGLLQRYVDEHGTARVLKDCRYEGCRLGGWVTNQRARRALLDDRQVALLEALPGWVWDRNESRWDEGFRHLLQYIAEHGNTLIAASRDYRGYPLGDWAAIQRRDFQSGKLSAERRKRLAAVPEWVWSLEANRWEEGYRRVEEYAAAHGTSLIPSPYETPHGFRLGAWVNFQRTRYSKGKLEPDRIERLEQLPGWVWSASDAKWDKAFSLLAEYARRHGTARVPRGTVVDGVNLADWVINNRAKFDKLSADRRQRLQSLPGWVGNTNTAQWEQGLRLLRDYLEENGTAAVPRGFAVDGFPLGAWVGSRRQEYKSGKLNAGRAAVLEGLPGWKWNPRSGKWDQALNRLLSFVDEHGHVNIPDDYECDDGYRLGAWARQQRSLYKRGELTPDRIGKLEAIQRWSWGYLDDRWDAAFARLTAYVVEYGTARVAAKYKTGDGFALGVWVSTQRGTYLRGKMPAERAARLESLSGWKWSAVK